jgi:hypothetical protein
VVPATPRLPANALLLAGLFAGAGLLRLIPRSSLFLSWLGGASVSSAALGWLAGLVLVAGLVAQDGSAWYRDIKGSWPFALSAGLVLLNLSLAIWRRSASLTPRNLGWLSAHLGMWLVMGAMAVGSADIIRLRIAAEKARPVSEAGLAGPGAPDVRVPLPFSLVLEDFVIDRYPPRLVLSAHPSGRTMHTGPLAQGTEGGWNGLRWKVIRFIPSAKPRGRRFVRDSSGRGEFAALLGFVGSSGRKSAGWLAPASGGRARRIVLLEGGLVASAETAPRQYRSLVTFVDADGARKSGSIEVNRPFRYRGWLFYQASYDDSAGDRSRLSVLEAVRDPWLGAVWAGFVLMVAGLGWLFLAGLRPRGGP